MFGKKTTAKPSTAAGDTLRDYGHIASETRPDGVHWGICGLTAEQWEIGDRAASATDPVNHRAPQENVMPFDWSQLSAEERGNAFRAHHIDGMPYPDDVDIDAVVEQLTQQD